MTIVIRITLSLLVVVTMVTFTADADGQIFRRMRDNIRSNYSPQGQVAPARAVPVQTAPQPQRPGQVITQPQRQYGQSLTPYSRLTPQQRSAPAAAQPNRSATAANSNANSGQVNVRVVTYYDPRTGRTYQRRFIVPPNNAANQAGSRKIASSQPPAATQTVPQKRMYDKIPKPLVANPSQQAAARPAISVVQQPKFEIPPVRSVQTQPRVQQPTVTAQPLPVLAGPQTVAAPPALVSPVPSTTSVQQPSVQPVPQPNIVIDTAQTPADAGSGIVIDPAVAPATVSSDDISVGSPDSEDVSSDVFSVLESPIEVSAPEPSADNEAAEPLDFDIEIDSADEVEAFFNQ